MAIPIARVHLKMAHAALPGLLPTPAPKCVAPLLSAPRCASILPTSSPPKPSRADAAERWDAHKIKPDGSPASSSSSSSCGQRSCIGGKSSSPGRASSCERWDSNKKSLASSSAGSTSRLGSRSSSGSRADSEDRWDAHKKPVSPASSPPSSSASSNKWRPKSRASKNSMELWGAHKKPNKEQRVDEHDDDGESSTASNEMEMDMQLPPPPPPAIFAGPGFVASPEPSMLPMPSSFMIRAA
ncbi:hypothetical protein BS78_05G055600 [Paspalum vaginatum]|nr:hypothetical protein BS78_05G055600 [Paspalum vaginatum]